LLDEEAPPARLALDDVLTLQAHGAVVLDTRDGGDYGRGHLRGSIDVGLGGRFAEYAGSVLDPDQSVVLVCDPGHELEAKVRLARIGFDRVVGALDDPIRAFVERPDLVAQSSRLRAHDLAQRLVAHRDVQLVDVRSPEEIAVHGTIARARRIPLSCLRRELAALERTRPTVAFCSGGYRSVMAASTLSAHGFDDVSDLLGGFHAWRAAGLPVVDENAQVPEEHR
jgi:hydroxyacylglutathione hydrolase